MKVYFGGRGEQGLGARGELGLTVGDRRAHGRRLGGRRAWGSGARDRGLEPWRSKKGAGRGLGFKA